ncbi:hypothetical protein ACTXT7_012374 [Hymenolepis weldensis]
MSHKGNKEGCPTLASSRTPKSSPKCLGQCNHTRAKPMLVYRPERSALVDDKYKQSEEIGFAKLVPHAKWPEIMLIRSATIGTVISSLRQFSPPRLVDFSRSQSLPVSVPSKFNVLDKQLLGSQGEEKVEEILSSLQFGYLTMSHIGVRHRKHLPFRYPTLTSKPNAGPREIFLDASYLLPPRNPETPEIQRINLKNIQC